ncbi:hypothetical protein QJQ45_027412, partial [Haematococcus lacustris]
VRCQGTMAPSISQKQQPQRQQVAAARAADKGKSLMVTPFPCPSPYPQTHPCRSASPLLRYTAAPPLPYPHLTPLPPPPPRPSIAAQGSSPEQQPGAAARSGSHEAVHDVCSHEPAAMWQVWQGMSNKEP